MRASVRDAADVRAEARVVAGDEVVDEQAHVLAAVAERRDVNREDVDAIEEVFAEAPGLHLGGEIAVRRRDDADVDLHVLGVAEAPDRLLLQDAQELHLEVERQLADLVEKERPARGLLEEAAPVGDGVGERALLVPEELATRAGSRGSRRS